MGDDYKAKLEKFFALVPKTAKATRINKLSGVEYYGEVLSGSPLIPFRKGEREAAVKAVESASISDNADFTTLTGLTHRRLLENWKGGGFLTSCNAFVMKAGQAVGVRGLGGFNVEETMAGLSRQRCWITPYSGEKPQFGDVFETRSRTPGNTYDNLHVGISLEFIGDDWYTIEGGQGGPVAGVDIVGRLKRKYDTAHMLGWVDIRLLASGLGAVPDWLIGNWMIYCGDQKYIYTFNRYSEAKQKAFQSSPGQYGSVPDLDSGNLVAVMGDTVKLVWDLDGGLEVFTYDRMHSCPGLNERMNGVAADGSPLQGVRL